LLLHRLGFSPQIPKHRPVERDEEDEAGHTLRPPKARTLARPGRTPVVEVSGKGSGRISVAKFANCRCQLPPPNVDYSIE
jgi:hypothetical protein